jgi:hypothetical protein
MALADQSWYMESAFGTKRSWVRIPPPRHTFAPTTSEQLRKRQRNDRRWVSPDITYVKDCPDLPIEPDNPSG